MGDGDFWKGKGIYILILTFALMCQGKYVKSSFYMLPGRGGEF